jgi:C1A family cysteine protease
MQFSWGETMTVRFGSYSAALGKGLGWHRDLPDARDFTVNQPDVKAILVRSKPLKAAVRKLPTSVDLRPWCSPIEDQEDIGSCTAHAGLGLLEYFQCRAFQKHLDGSRLFLYKATRDLLGWEGDTGAYLRSTMKAMALFGVPPEEYWPYTTSLFDTEPSAFLYALGQSYRSLKYYRHDPPGITGARIVSDVKTALAAQLPSMFGFTVYSSMPPLGEGTGEIPFPKSEESVLGGHAVVAVGYSDAKKIGSAKGAFLIRNSWGTDWGVQGYGWLPYRYVTEGLADDFWSLVDAGFVATDLFE